MSKNCTLEEIAGLLLKNGSFVLCPHVSPDGDALGSTLGKSRQASYSYGR